MTEPNTLPIKPNDTTTSSSKSSNHNNENGGGGWGKSLVNAIQKKRDAMAANQDAKTAGKIWNSTTKQYEFYFLDLEQTQLETEIQKQQEQIQNNNNNNNTNGGGGSSSSSSSSTTTPVVADREYYDLLQIPTNADANVIKKAYYREARNCHPDKHPDDPKAHEKFTLLGHAYQVLSDPSKREQYDRYGKSSDSTNNASEMMHDAIDPSVFFNVMFGSSLVEPYIGELWLSSQTDSMMKDMSHPGEGETDVTEEEMMAKMEIIRRKNDLKQKLRQVTCAKNLRDRISTYSKETREAFIQGCKDEATKICAGSFGDLYCMTIGFALQVAAEEYIGFETSLFGLGGHVARTKKNASGFASGMKLFSAGVKAVGAGSKVMREAEDLQKKTAIAKETTKDAGGGDNHETNPSTTSESPEIKEEDAQQMMASIEGSVPAFLEFAWAVNKRDIQSTLRHVCKKLFDDASVPKSDRLQRAEAVRILGTVFQKNGKHHQSKQSSKDGLKKDNAIARVKVATMATMAKAQGQEVTEEDQEIMFEQARMTHVTGHDATTTDDTTTSKKAATDTQK